MLCISRQLFNMPSKNKKKKWALLVSYSHLLSTAQSGLAHVMEASYCLKPLTESRWSMQCGPHWWDWCDQQWEPVTQPQTGHREALLQPKVYNSSWGHLRAQTLCRLLSEDLGMELFWGRGTSIDLHIFRTSDMLICSNKTQTYACWERRWGVGFIFLILSWVFSILLDCCFLLSRTYFFVEKGFRRLLSCGLISHNSFKFKLSADSRELDASV